MHWWHCAVVIPLLLGGCSGFVTSPDAADTVTPAPVPSESNEQRTGGFLPPGVTENGLLDAEALVDAHRQQLDNQSYQLDVRITSGEERAHRLVRVESPTRYYWRDNGSDSSASVTAFADGSQLYIRTNRSGIPSYNRGNVSGRPSTPTTRLIRPFLEVQNVSVTKIRVDTQVRYELAGRFDVHPNIESFENYTVRVLVAPSGLIHSLDVQYTTTASSSGPANVSYSYQYTAVGSTTVSRPGWVENQWN